MINCIAIDDEPLALQQIASYIEKIDFLNLKAACRSALEARTFIDEGGVDAMFVDINMPDLNGFDFVKNLEKRPLVVFTTAYDNYAVNSYKVNAVDYLLKPFGFDDFMRAADKLKKRYEVLQASLSAVSPVDNDDSVFFKSERRIVKVDINSISYIEGMSEYLKIHIDNEKPLLILMSMKKLEASLPSEKFMRIHKSYIVNLKRIVETNKVNVVLDTGTSLPIGEFYRKQFEDYINRKFLA